MVNFLNKQTPPKSIVSIYTKHLGGLLIVSVLILLGLIILLQHQISPYFYADLYEEVETSYRTKADAISLALIQNNEARAESLIAETDFAPGALSKKLIPYSPSNEEAFHNHCNGQFEFQPWGQTCLADSRAQILLPIRSGDNLLGYVQVEMEASLTKWLPFERILHGVYLSLAVLIAISGILGLLFFRSMVFPVRNAMARIHTANEEADFKPVLNSLPFQELFHLTSRLADKSSELTHTRLELERAKHRDELADVAAQVSHDIQSPMAMLLSVARNQTQMDSTQQKKLIESATSKLLSMTGDLIKKYRGEETSSPEGLTVLGPLFHSVIEEKKAELSKNTNVELISECPLDLSTSVLKISETELARILSNILNNSVSALSGQQKAEISVKIARIFDGPFLQISISDSGMGMTEDILQKVRTIGGSYNKPGGTGLGLSHAKKVLSQCGGKLEIDSIPGQGTTVRLLVPELIFPKKKNTSAPDLVLIDNDENVRKVWELEAQAKGLYLIDAGDDSQIELKNLPKETTFFVDNNLSNGKSGIEVCKKLYSLGFQNLFLATGDRGIEKPSFVLGIVGKQFPPLFS